jgi:Fe-S-cluster containining protein
MSMNPFPCDSCGLCCRHVDRSEYTQALDRGDGVCEHFQVATSTCKIYERRPDVCRIDSGYAELGMAMTWAQYQQANADVCNALRAEHGWHHLHQIIIQEEK